MVPGRSLTAKTVEMVMREVWVGNNRRALAWGMLPPGLVALSALAVFALSSAWAWRAAALLAALPAAAMVILLAWWMRIPRLAYHQGKLLVYLDGFRPLETPIEIVECFFRGQGDSMLGVPQRAGQPKPQTATIVVRLAEKADAWRQRRVRASLGAWCDGYITLRGTWCEPITAQLLERLNKRLVEVHRQRHAT